MVGRYQKRARTSETRGEARDVCEPQRGVLTRQHDAVDRPGTQTRHPQQHFAIGAVHVDGKQMPIAQCPGQLRIDFQIQHSICGGRNDVVN